MGSSIVYHILVYNMSIYYDKMKVNTFSFTYEYYIIYNVVHIYYTINYDGLFILSVLKFPIIG